MSERIGAIGASGARPLGLAPALTTAALIALFFWLMVGDLGISIRERSALPSGLELLRRHSVSDTATSLLLSTMPALLSLMLVPLIGYHSDRYRSRWGRRRPFLMVAAPVGAAAMIGLACSPDLGVWLDMELGPMSPGIRLCQLGWFCVFWTIFECAAISTFALYTGLVNDVVPKGLLGRFYAGVRILGLGVGIAFNTWVFALLDYHLYEILIGIGLLFGLPVMAMCLMIREAPCPAPAADPDPAQPIKYAWRVPRAHLAACFTERRYLWAFAAFMLAGVTFSPFNTFYQYYAQMSGLSKATLGSLTAWGYAVSIVSAFGIGWLVDRHGAVRVSAIVMGLYLATAAGGFLLVAGEASFRVFYLAHVVISGAYFTAAASMPMALFPHGRFVQFNSTKDLLVACASIVVSSAQGPVLDMSGHNYRLTLLSAAVFSLLCVLCLARLHRGGRQLG